MRGSFVCLVFLCLLAPLAARAQDRDGDRLLDDLDLCPDAAEGPATLFPGDGCPDVDTDGDRIVDDHDVCPAEPGVQIAPRHAALFIWGNSAAMRC
jgi:hypothetical protein